MTVRVWDASNGNAIAVLKHIDFPLTALFSSDAAMVVSSEGKTIRVWDSENGQEIAQLNGHTDSVWSVSFSPDGNRLLTSSSDGTARVWDIASTKGLVRNRSIVVASAMARGIGRRLPSEQADILMQEAEDDLYAGILHRLGRASDDPEIAEFVASLQSPLHPNCYLSPTQLEEHFAVALIDHGEKLPVPGTDRSICRAWARVFCLIALLVALGLSALVAFGQIDVMAIVERMRTVGP